MLNSGKKSINILTLVLSEKKFLTETKNHKPPPLPPFRLNGRSLSIVCYFPALCITPLNSFVNILVSVSSLP